MMFSTRILFVILSYFVHFSNTEFDADLFPVCMERLKQNNIKAKPYTYDQLAKIGPLYYRSYCRIDVKTRHQYSCARIHFLPKTNTSNAGIMDFNFTLDLIPVSFHANFGVDETNVPGVFYLYEKMTGVDGRILAVLDIAPGLMVIYHCSVDTWQYNDFILYRTELTSEHTDLKPYVSSPNCHYFNISQQSCPSLSISFTPESVGNIIIILEKIYNFIFKLVS